MSVTPNDPWDLPQHMRPAEFGGTGRRPVWRIMSDQLPGDLNYRRDPGKRTHGFVEPSKVMLVDEYVSVIEMTEPSWVRHGAQ